MKFYYIALLISLSIPSIAQKSEKQDLFNLSLEELMDLKVTVASKKALTQRESPGAISVVTKEEIENSGARDLIDILRLVPGIEFGSDSERLVGISIRGIWGFEGKVLLMKDCHELNERLYSTTQFGNHYPVDNIKRIEIIRGPGSAIYGGFAELGVINIITETGNDINGVKATLNYGKTNNSNRENINIAIGKKISDLEFSINGFIGNGNRSDKTYSGIYNYSFNMTDSTHLNPTLINGNIKYKNLELKVLYDQYNTTSGKSGSMDFTSLSGEIKYNFSVSDKITITPSIAYIRTTPWEFTYYNDDPDYVSPNYSTTITRIKPNATANFDISEKTNIVTGFEYYSETGENKSNDGNPLTFWNDSNKVTLSNVTFFAQALFNTSIVNITIGGRIENNSEFGTAFAPRVGLTKCFEKFHSKLLFSQAFRSPGLGNIDINATYTVDKKPHIKPEQTRVIEFEAGYKLNPDMAITANLYYININKPIIYSSMDGYNNKDQTGSKGIELEYKVRKNWGYLNLNYAYYSAKEINKVPDYTAKDKSSRFLAAPQHKASLIANFKLIKNLSFNPTLTYLGERDFCVLDEETFNINTNKKDPLMMANVYFNYKNVIVKNLNIGAGCYNLFDSNYEFIQAHKGFGETPLPGQGREFVLKLSYKL